MPWAAASSATSPKPSRYDGRHDGQRAGVERGQLGVVDAPQAVADDDELGVEAACACALVGGRGDVEALARIAGADEEQVAPGAAAGSRAGAAEGPPSTPGETTVAPTPHAARSSAATACESAVTAAAPRASARGRARRCQARS